MTSRKRTTVTIETRHRTIVRRNRGQAIAWCERCRAEVQILSPDEVAEFVHMTAGDFFRRIEAGELHVLETDSGGLLICRNLPADKSAHSEEE